MNIYGYDREALRAAANYSADPNRQQAARDEIVRRELEYETDDRIGRRKAGGDLGVGEDD